MKNNNKKTVESGAQSIQRALKITNLIASFNVDGLRVVDVAESLKISRPTTYRIMQNLVSEGWLLRKSYRYFLGHKLFELGITAAPQFKLRELCQPSLERIARRTKQIAFLTIRSGLDAISITRSSGKQVDLVALQIGVHRPLGIGAGSLCLLSNLSDEEVSQIVTANARRIRKYADINTGILLENVNLCRQRGFAYHDHRLLNGVSGIAVPITDESGLILGAISISSFAPSIEHELTYEIVAKLRKEAKIIQSLIVTDIGYAAEKVRLLSQN